MSMLKHILFSNSTKTTTQTTSRGEGFFSYTKYLLLFLCILSLAVSASAIVLEPDTTVVLDPDLTTQNFSETYTVEITNNGSYAIYFIEIRAPETGFSIEDNLVCPKNWIEGEDTETKVSCFTLIGSDDVIEPQAEPATVTFNAKSAGSDDVYVWGIYTGDIEFGTNLNETQTTTVDGTAPITAILPDGSDWESNNVSFTLDCTDASSECKETYYKIINAGDTCPGDGYTPGESGTVECSVGQVCQKKVCYYSTDDLENQEDAKESETFNIDKQKPITTDYSDTDWHAEDQTITLTPDDSTGSGVVSTGYCVYDEGEAPCDPIQEGKTTLVLEDKINWVSNTANGKKAVLTFDTVGPTFNYEFEVFGTPTNRLLPTTKYSLIYYADKPERFEDWGGNNPGKLIAEFTTDGEGLVPLTTGSVELNMNLPDGDDWNIDPDPNYCDNSNGFDDYENCSGAKIWLVPTAALPDPYPGDGSWEFWDTTGILFETDMVTYTDSELEGISVTVTCPEDSVCEQRIKYYSRDSVGNPETIKTSNVVKIDKSNPQIGPINIEPHIGIYVSGVSDITATPVTDTGSEAISCKYTVDGGENWIGADYDSGTCSATEVNTASATSINMQATDGVDNVGIGTAVGVTPDTIAPIVSVDGAPADWQKSATMTVECIETTGSGCKEASYAYEFYDEDPVSCPEEGYASGEMVGVIAHKWACAYAEDNVGNASVSAPTEFKVDIIEPTITDDYAEDGIWVNSDQTVTLNPQDTGDSGIKEVKYCESIGCDLASGTILGSSPYEINYSEGTTITEYQAEDNASNLSLIGSYTVMIDESNPTAGVVDDAPSWQNSTATATVTCSDQEELSGCDESSKKLYISTTEIETCLNTVGSYDKASPQIISQHSWVCSYAKDNAGNEDFSDEPTEFKVDETNPEGSLSGVPANWQNSDASIELSCTDLGGSDCDSGEDYLTIVPKNGNCVPTDQYTGAVIVSTHSTACWKVTDNAGNSNEGSEKIQVDEIVPVVETVDVTPTTGLMDQYTMPSVTISAGITDAGGSGVNGCKYTTDDGASWDEATWNGTTCTKTLSGLLEEQTYQFNIKGIDVAGNEGFGGIEERMVDSTLPETTILPDDSSWTIGDVGFTLDCDDASSGCNETYYAIIDEIDDCPATGNEYTTGTTGDVTCNSDEVCQKKVCYYSTDNAGNEETPINVSGIFNIDKQKPTTSDDAPTTWQDSDVTVTLTPNDELGSGISDTKYCIDETDQCTPNTSGTSASVTCSDDSVCQKYVRYYSTDLVGNQKDVKSSVIIKIDKQNPVVEEIKVNPEIEQYISTSVTISAGITDAGGSGVNGCKYTTDDGASWDEATWNGTTCTKTLSGLLEEQTYQFNIKGIDNVGNEAIGIAEERIVDIEGPEITNIVVDADYTYTDSLWTADTLNLSATVTDDVSGVDVESVEFFLVSEGNDIETCVVVEDAGVYSCNIDVSELDGIGYEIRVEAVDKAENSNSETSDAFNIDNTSPTTTKEIGDNKYVDGEEWITPNTEITLTVDDGDGVGVKEICYKIDEEAQVCTDEEEVIIPSLGTEGDHTLEFWAVDLLSNEETRHGPQTHHVDDSAPKLVKEIGIPSTECTEGITCEESFKTDEGTIDAVWEWKVAQMTPIELNCDDSWENSKVSPVGESTVYFRHFKDGNRTEDLVEQSNADPEGWINDSVLPHTVYFPENAMYQLEFYCVDALENKSETDVEIIKVEGTQFTIELNEKWNLISVPFALINPSIEEVLDDVKDDVKTVWAYDPLGGCDLEETEDIEEKWCVYHPDNPSISNLKTMEQGWGYWLYAKNPTSLIVGGSNIKPGPVVPASRNLKAGWNLIGYYSNYGSEENEITTYDGPDGEGKRVSEALISLGADLLDKGAVRVKTFWELNDPQWIDLILTGWKISRMDPGAGYWILTPEDYIYG